MPSVVGVARVQDGSEGGDRGRLDVAFVGCLDQDVLGAEQLAGGGADDQCYTYDNLQRLTNAYTSSAYTSATNCAAASKTKLGSASPYWDAYTYDKSGNRTKDVAVTGTGSAQKSTTFAYTYPAATAVRPHGVTKVTGTGSAASTETLAYDAVGNTTSDASSSTVGHTMTWDAEGHEAAVTDKSNSSPTTYVDDADGNRLIKKDAYAGTITAYIGFGEYKLTTATGTVSTIRNYTLGGTPVATRNSSGLKVLIADAQGTPVLQVDGTSLAVVKRRFTAFGAVLAAGTFTTPNTFLNKTNDTTSTASGGTVHLGAREYNPKLGRFLSVDPVLDPGDPQQMNGYAYANNSPVMSADPTGLQTDKRDTESGHGYGSGDVAGAANAASFANYKGKAPSWHDVRDFTGNAAKSIVTSPWHVLHGFSQSLGASMQCMADYRTCDAAQERSQAG